MVMAPVTAFIDATALHATVFKFERALSYPSLSMWMAGPMTEVLQRRAQERFLAQGSDLQGGSFKNWKPLSAATIQFRQAAGYGPVPINVRSGELERYVTGAVGRVGPTPAGVSMVWPGATPGGTLGEKVARAQGRDDPNPAARPVIGLAAQDLALMMTSLQSWMLAALA
jgi:hypothetical protein